MSFLTNVWGQIVAQLSGDASRHPSFVANADEYMHVSDAGFLMLTLEEGRKLKSYKDSVGIWTIGIGFTSDKSLGIVVGPGMVITPVQCDAMLKKYSVKFETALNKALNPNNFGRPIPQNVFDAMFILTWNIGIGAMQKSSFIRDWNAGKPIEQIASDFMLWVHPPELTARRKRECLLLLHGQYRSV